MENEDSEGWLNASDGDEDEDSEEIVGEDRHEDVSRRGPFSRGKCSASSHSRALFKHEVYARDDLQKLGSYKVPWDPSMDEQRVYDNENGITCHQCR